MEKKQSKITTIVDEFYNLVRISFLFWITLFKQVVVYGWLSSIYQILYDSFKDVEYMSAEKKYRNNRLTLKYQKSVSFIFSSLVFIAILFLWLNNRFEIGNNVLLISLVFLIQLLIVYFVWIGIVALEHEDSAIIYAKSLDLMVRNFSLSVSIWLLVLASLLLANINLVIFIFVIPGLFGKILKQLLVKKQNLIKI